MGPAGPFMAENDGSWGRSATWKITQEDDRRNHTKACGERYGWFDWSTGSFILKPRRRIHWSARSWRNRMWPCSAWASLPKRYRAGVCALPPERHCQFELGALNHPVEPPGLRPTFRPTGKPPYPHRPEPTGRHPQNPRPMSAVASYLEMNKLALLDISWYRILNDIKKLLAWKRRYGRSLLLSTYLPK